MENAGMVILGMAITVGSRIRTGYLFELMKEGKVSPKVVRFNNRIALFGIVSCVVALFPALVAG
jgi:hypothetical protein